MKFIALSMLCIMFFLQSIAPVLAGTQDKDTIARMRNDVSQCKTSKACEFKMLDDTAIIGYADSVKLETFTLTNPFTNEQTVIEYAKIKKLKKIKIIPVEKILKKLPEAIAKKRVADIKLLDGTKLTGYITNFDDQTLTLQEKKNRETRVIPLATIAKFDAPPKGQRVIKRVVQIASIGFAAIITIAIIALHNLD